MARVPAQWSNQNHSCRTMTTAISENDQPFYILWTAMRYLCGNSGKVESSLELQLRQKYTYRLSVTLHNCRGGRNIGSQYSIVQMPFTWNSVPCFRTFRTITTYWFYIFKHLHLLKYCCRYTPEQKYSFCL